MVRAIYVGTTEYGDLFIYDQSNPRRFNPCKDKYFLIPSGQESNFEKWEFGFTSAISRARTKLGLLDLPVKNYKYSDLIPYYGTMILANQSAQDGDYEAFSRHYALMVVWENMMGLDFENEALDDLEIAAKQKAIAKIYDQAVTKVTVYSDLEAVAPLQEKALALSAQFGFEFDPQPYRLLILENFEKTMAKKQEVAEYYATLGFVSEVERLANEAGSLCRLAGVPFVSDRYDDLIDQARKHLALLKLQDLARFCYIKNLPDEAQFLTTQAQALGSRLGIAVNMKSYGDLTLTQSGSLDERGQQVVANQFLEVIQACADLGLYEEVQNLNSHTLALLEGHPKSSDYEIKCKNHLTAAKQNALHILADKVQDAFKRQNAAEYRSLVLEAQTLCEQFDVEYSDSPVCQIVEQNRREFLQEKNPR